MNIFNNRLKELRDIHGIELKELAEIMDVSIRSYQRYESGEREPSIEQLIAIANYYNVSVDYLFGRTEYCFRIDEPHTEIDSPTLPPLHVDALTEAIEYTGYEGDGGEVTHDPSEKPTKELDTETSDEFDAA